MFTTVMFYVKLFSAKRVSIKIWLAFFRREMILNAHLMLISTLLRFPEKEHRTRQLYEVFVDAKFLTSFRLMLF